MVVRNRGHCLRTTPASEVGTPWNSHPNKNKYDLERQIAIGPMTREILTYYVNDTDGQKNVHTTHENHAVRRGERRITRELVSFDFVHQYENRNEVTDKHGRKPLFVAPGGNDLTRTRSETTSTP